MSSTLAQLYSSLGRAPLKPVYLIATDVTLLAQEAREHLRKAAEKAGFLQRDTYHVLPSFNWDNFFAQQQNYNLFSEKVFIELNNPSAKFDAATTKRLLEYLNNPPADKILLILTNKLTSAQQKTKWHKAVESKGMCTHIRNITKAELPQWISQRAQAAKVTLERESIALLAELTEGNLLATQQALQKLSLLYAQQKIDPKKVFTVISDNARFNVFDLSNQMLTGDVRSALRCLNGLKNTGVEATLILWALAREIREILNLAFQRQQGANLAQLLQSQWQSRRGLLKSALSRLTLKDCNKLLLLAENADLIIKGQSPGNLWNALETIVMTFCGKKIPSAIAINGVSL